MTPEQFCYWMQGFTELSGGFPPTTEQWKSITEHLQTVFVKRTPPLEDAINNMKKKTYPPHVNPSDVKPFDMGRWPIDLKPGDIVC